MSKQAEHIWWYSCLLEEEEEAAVKPNLAFTKALDVLYTCLIEKSTSKLESQEIQLPRIIDPQINI